MKKISCKHDYKNAVKVGNIDYQCPLCGKLLDPNEWFFMNSFEFVDVDVKKEIKIKRKIKLCLIKIQNEKLSTR